MTAPRFRRARLLTAAALTLTAAGFVVAVLEPPWLTGPLHDAVLRAGPAAGVQFVALCVVAAPLHLTGLCTTLSLVVWPLPVAAALLARAGTRRARQRDGWPAWLEGVADRVERRPLLVGVAVRFVVQSGLVVEAFFLLTGYSRRRYLVVTTVGFALYLAQTVLGVLALTALVRISPWLGLLLVAIPATAAVLVVAVRRRGPAA